MAHTAGKETMADMLTREAGYKLEATFTLDGTGAQVKNGFIVTGSVLILNQFNIIRRVGSAGNLTNVYATLYDGTNTVNVTADGATLTGMPVGTFFTKDKVSTSEFSVADASQCRMTENISEKLVGRPFVLTQKNGATTYLRIHYTTTDNPIDVDMFTSFEFLPLNGGNLTLA